MIDYNDQNAAWQIAIENQENAKQYDEQRTRYAKAKVSIGLELTEAYKDNKIKDTLSFDKAILMLLNIKPELKTVYQDLVEAEQSYKGLERILDANQACITLYQSIIKNHIKNGVE